MLFAGCEELPGIPFTDTGRVLSCLTRRDWPTARYVILTLIQAQAKLWRLEGTFWCRDFFQSRLMKDIHFATNILVL